MKYIFAYSIWCNLSKCLNKGILPYDLKKARVGSLLKRKIKKYIFPRSTKEFM